MSLRITLFSVIMLSLWGLRVEESMGLEFTSSYIDGGTWNTVYVQGFSPSLNAMPDPGYAPDMTVHLDEFQFFKSGTPDNATDIQVAILDAMFYNFTVPLTTSSPALLGLSTNVMSDTASVATGDALTFAFDSVPLTYAEDYAAVFVQDDGAGNLTPVLVSALTADYLEDPPGSGIWVPVTNYGTHEEFEFSTSNFLRTDGFFNSFDYAGDANFAARFDIEEPDFDFDNNGVLDCADIDALVGEIAGGTNSAPFDLTGDGLVNLADRDAWLAGAGGILLPSGNPFRLGDANLDGVVDVGDFNIWNSNKFTPVAAWCSGDFNADGSVDVGDFNVWNANKFTSSANSVPEPASWLMCTILWALGVGLLRQRYC